MFVAGIINIKDFIEQDKKITHTHTHKSLTLCDWVPVCLHEKSFRDKQNTFAAVWGKIRGSGKVMEESVSVNHTNYLQL